VKGFKGGWKDALGGKKKHTRTGNPVGDNPCNSRGFDGENWIRKKKKKIKTGKSSRHRFIGGENGVLHSGQ